MLSIINHKTDQHKLLQYFKEFCHSYIMRKDLKLGLITEEKTCGISVVINFSK